MCARAQPEDMNHAPHAKVGVNNGKG